MYFFTVPWGKNLRSRCQHSHSPSEASREESFVACPSLWGCWHSLACDHTSLCFVFTSPSPLYLSFLLSQVPAVVTSLALPCSSFLNGELISAEEGVTLHYIPRVLCCDFPIRVFQGLHTALLSTVDTSHTVGFAKSYDSSCRTACPKAKTGWRIFSKQTGF